MLSEEQAKLVWDIYQMYRYRNYTQEEIAQVLKVNPVLVGKITRKWGFHHTTTDIKGERLYFLLDDFLDCFE